MHICIYIQGLGFRIYVYLYIYTHTYTYIHTYILGGAVRAQGNGILFCRACLNKRMLYNDVSRALSPLVGLFGTSVPNMGHHGPV